MVHRVALASILVLAALAALAACGDDAARRRADAGTADAAAASGAIAGTLIGSTTGAPLASRTVVVVDATGTVTTTTTDAAGHFATTGVATPYDLGIPDLASAAHAQASYYAGLMRPDPIVVGADDLTTPDLTERDITVTFSATACATCPIFVSNPDDSSRFDGFGSGSAYSGDYTYTGAPAHADPFHVYVTQAYSTTNTGAFTGKLDIAAQSFTAGDTVALGVLAFSAVTNGSLAFTATTPATYTFEEGAIDVIDPDTSRVAGVTYGASSIVNYPMVDDLAAQLVATAFGPNGESIAARVQYPISGGIPATVAMDLLAAPELTAPADQAIAITAAQPLTWTAFAAPTTYATTISTATGATTTVYTAATTIDLARLALGEVALAPATSYSWLVATTGIATMDELATTPTTAPPSAITMYGQSPSQAFVTQ